MTKKYARKGYCKLIEFSEPTLSELLFEMSGYAAKLEEEKRTLYCEAKVAHLEDNVREIDWWHGTIYFGYFLHSWEDLDEQLAAAAVEFLEA